VNRNNFLRSAIAFASMPWLSACQRNNGEQPPDPVDPPPPEWVYIPSPDLRVEVTIDLPLRVKIGQTLRIRAKRETFGSWLRVRHATLPPDARWFTSPWPAVEPEVAANLAWKTDPPLAMRFDTGLQSAGLGMEREGVFKAAGRFDVWALTATPIPGKSNVLRIEVS
jgi:hypothetical protein